MLLSSLLNATFLSAGSKGVDVEQLLSKLLKKILFSIKKVCPVRSNHYLYCRPLYHQASRTFACTHSGKEKA